MKRVAIYLLVIVGALAVTGGTSALADENSSANRLPKLISGEIDVSEAEEKIEEVV